MGYAVAAEAAARGARVLARDRAGHAGDPPAGVEVTAVRSAAEMHAAVGHAPRCRTPPSTPSSWRRPWRTTPRPGGRQAAKIRKTDKDLVLCVAEDAGRAGGARRAPRATATGAGAGRLRRRDGGCRRAGRARSSPASAWISSSPTTSPRRAPGSPWTRTWRSLVSVKRASSRCRSGRSGIVARVILDQDRHAPRRAHRGGGTVGDVFQGGADRCPTAIRSLRTLRFFEELGVAGINRDPAWRTRPADGGRASGVGTPTGLGAGTSAGTPPVEQPPAPAPSSDAGVPAAEVRRPR